MNGRNSIRVVVYGSRVNSREIALERRGGSPAAIADWRQALRKYF